MMRPLLDGVRRAPLVAFIVLAFLFTWSLLPLAATSMTASLVALWGPAVAALVVTAAAGPAARRALTRRVTDWRIRWPWYVVALGLPLPISLLRSGLEWLWGANAALELQPVSALGLVVFVLVLGEEAGWRGFALPHLLPRVGPWRGSLVIGVVWALWHLPLFSMPGMPQSGSPFVPFIGYTIALSVILTVLARWTRGSVVIATVFHGAVNTFGVVNPAATPALRGWSNAVSYGIAALVLAGIAIRARDTSGVAPSPVRVP